MFDLLDVRNVDDNFLKQNYEALEIIENYVLMTKLRGHIIICNIIKGFGFSGDYHDVAVSIFVKDNPEHRTRSFVFRIYNNPKRVTKGMFYIGVNKETNFNPKKMSFAFKKAGISTWNKTKTKYGDHHYEFYLYNSSSQVQDLLVLFGPYIV